MYLKRKIDAFLSEWKNNADKKMLNAFFWCLWGIEPQTSLFSSFLMPFIWKFQSILRYFIVNFLCLTKSSLKQINNKLNARASFENFFGTCPFLVFRR